MPDERTVIHWVLSPLYGRTKLPTNSAPAESTISSPKRAELSAACRSPPLLTRMVSPVGATNALFRRTRGSSAADPIGALGGVAVSAGGAGAGAGAGAGTAARAGAGTTTQSVSSTRWPWRATTRETPGAAAVASPLPSTVATSGCDDVQRSPGERRVPSSIAAPSAEYATSCFVAPIATVSARAPAGTASGVDVPAAVAARARSSEGANGTESLQAAATSATPVTNIIERWVCGCLRMRILRGRSAARLAWHTSLRCVCG